MSKAIVHYFPDLILGESIRQLLVHYYQGEIEDRRYTSETWAKFKSKTPFGQLPVLEIDGKQYAQSVAICRYLGKKYGLAGQNDEEAFEIDQNVDFVRDVCATAAAVHVPDEAANAKKQEENSKKLHDLLEKLNTLIENNSGFLATSKLTWGDFILADLFDYFKITQQPDFKEKYPAIYNVIEQIGFISFDEDEEEE